MYGGRGNQEDIPTSPNTKSSTLDAIKRIRAPGRPRVQSYRTLDGLLAGRDAVAWYWRSVGIASSFLILGGFLMLPVTFERDPVLRVAEAALGIFALALLTAGFSFTALLCYAVRNPLFRADNVFLPAFTSCALGLLTVFYNFLVFERYYWNTPALLVTVGAAVSTTVYGGLLIWAQRRVGIEKTRIQCLPVPMMQMGTTTRNSAGAETSHRPFAQEQTYYSNYNQNMFPSAYSRAGEGLPQQPPPPLHTGGGYDPNCITEEEMQRQQMLMLLLTREEQPASPHPTTTSSTYQIDWQEEDAITATTPTGGWFAPPPPMTATHTPSSSYSQSAKPFSASAQSNSSPITAQDLRPWDGVWREVRRPASQDLREARRREIEGLP